MKGDQERVSTLLKETVKLLCSNGLGFQKSLRVQGLLGITIDEGDIFIIQIDDLTSKEGLQPISAAIDVNLSSSGPEPAVTKVKSRDEVPCMTTENVPELFDKTDATAPNRKQRSNSSNSDPSKGLQNSNGLNQMNSTYDANTTLHEIPRSDEASENYSENPASSCSDLNTECEPTTLQHDCNAVMQLKDEIKIEDDDDDVSYVMEECNALLIPENITQNHKNPSLCNTGRTWKYPVSGNFISNQKSHELTSATKNKNVPDLENVHRNQSSVNTDGNSEYIDIASIRLQQGPSQDGFWSAVDRRLPNTSRLPQFTRQIKRHGFSHHYMSNRPLSSSRHPFQNPRRPIHSDAKQFVCDYPGCDKSYYERKNLLQHQSIKHGRTYNQRSSVVGFSGASGLSSD